MRVAVTGDWHVYNFQEFAKSYMVYWDEELLRYVKSDTEEELEGYKPMNSRLYNLLNGICDIRDYCEKEHIKYLLVTGDLFHNRATIDVTVYNSVYRVLKSFRDFNVKVVAIAGNHDDVDNSRNPLTSLHPLGGIIKVIEEPRVYLLSNVEENKDEYIEVVCLPYSKDKKYILDSMKELRDECAHPRDAILMCHLGITGGTVGSGMYSMKDEYSLKELMYDKWKYLVAGHYHQPQLLEYNSIYTGSPLQNNFGDERTPEGDDEGYNGFFVIDTNKRWDMRFVPIKAPRFITLSPEDLPNTQPNVFIENYVRIKANAKDSEYVNKELEDCLPELNVDSLNVRLELEKEYITEQRSDIGISDTFEESIEKYAQERYEGTQDIQKVKEIGLSILSQVTTGGGK